MKRSLLTAMASLSKMIVGWGFRPTKYQLINNYLKPKTLDDDDREIDLLMGEVNFRKFEPWELLDQSKIKSDDEEGFFFCPRDFKSLNSQLINRKTKAGFWKSSGKLVLIKDRRTKKVIGTKRTLVFFENAKPKPLTTVWVAEEYEYLPGPNLRKKRDFVLIKLKKNPEKKTHKHESNDHNMALISDSEGEPSHHMATDFGNQNPIEMTAKLTSDENELSQDLTSYFENQNLNEMVVNAPYNESELSHHFASNFENRNLEQLIAVPTDESWLVPSDFENQISVFELEGECTPTMKLSSDFENKPPFDGDEVSIPMAFDFENQNPSGMIAITPSELSHCKASNFENQNTNGITVDASSDLSRYTASDFENQVFSFEFEGKWSPSNEILSDFKKQSPYHKGELSTLMISDFENQNPNRITTDSLCIESESAHHVASDLENQNPKETIAISTHESWLMASNLQNQITPFEFEHEWSPLMGMPSDFKNQSSYDKGMSFDFENQNLDKRTYIPDSEEGKCCPLVEPPLDFDFQNPNQQTNMSTLEECYWVGLMALSPESKVAEALLPEVNPQLLEELEALRELENILNTPPQP